MKYAMRPDEMRVIIRPADAPDDSSRLIQASVFAKMFNSVFSAIKAANKDATEKKSRSEFFISHLKMGSNEFGILEHKRTSGDTPSPSIDLFKRCATSVIRNEFDRVDQFPEVAKGLVRIGDKLNPNYAILAQFADMELPIDGFFAKQTQRYKQHRKERLAPPYFAGNAIGSFEGVIGNIDYRGAAWTGHIVLPGGAGVQIECVFDKTKGEDSFNPFGNKRVSVTGRAIYTGESQLPERIEVITIQEIHSAKSYLSIQGSLTGKQYLDWDASLENLQ
ncbi:hypothetical protein [Neorhizobium sp. NCHU2750]|uniref:hypothetical protein n=1 Tax=Neorhizobium sp. NCHU2750 TaxID=1825976 RepID=UPI000EB68732|nr:hypothetical protein NCHU2750_26610 [Neorhizobium sp. NCHU2750]